MDTVLRCIIPEMTPGCTLEQWLQVSSFFLSTIQLTVLPVFCLFVFNDMQLHRLVFHKDVSKKRIQVVHAVECKLCAQLNETERHPAALTRTLESSIQLVASSQTSSVTVGALCLHTNFTSVNGAHKLSQFCFFGPTCVFVVHTSIAI